jgi:hypothetical protein
MREGGWEHDGTDIEVRWAMRLRGRHTLAAAASDVDAAAVSEDDEGEEGRAGTHCRPKMTATSRLHRGMGEMQQS